VYRPSAEFDITEPLLRSLLREQAPAFADLPLQIHASGWDNEIYRLGDHHAVRIPRRAVAAPLIGHEQRWLPVLAPTLPLPVPSPVVAGRPGAGFPWPWSIVPWLPGTAVGRGPASAAMAEQLGAFLQALHGPAPADAPSNQWRGGPLADRDDRVRRDLRDHLPGIVPAPTLTALEARWERLTDVPLFPGPPVWIHGDLHPLNALRDDGRFTAIVDFGDITAGDPATDLLMAWMLFEAPERLVLRRAVAADDATWARAQGWALVLSLVFAAHGDDDPVMAEIGRAAMIRILGDEPAGG